MGTIEDVLRDSLARHADDAPTVDELVGRLHRETGRRRRRFAAVGSTLVGAAAAVAVVAGVMTGLPDRDVVAGGEPSATATEPAAAPELGWPLVEGVPEGQQVVAYLGVEVLVPAAWEVNDYRCAAPGANTVLVPPVPSLQYCWAPEPPDLTIVNLEPLDVPVSEHPIAALATEDWTLRDEPVLRGYGTPDFPGGRGEPLEVLVLPEQGVVVSVESPDPEEAMRLLMTTRVAETEGAPTASATTPAQPLELGWPEPQGVPDGQQVVSYRGVEVLVPVGWTVDDMGCMIPVGDTVVVEGGVSNPNAFTLCLLTDPPVRTVVWVDPIEGTARDHPVARLATEPATLRGVPALRGRGVPAPGPTDPWGLPREVLVLPQQGVVVSVSSPDPDTAMRLLMTTRVSATDSAGCPASVDPLEVAPATRAGADEQLVPGDPVGGAVCRYTDGQLARSVRLDAAQVAELAGVLDAQAEGVGAAHPAEVDHGLGCAEIAAVERGFVAHLTYPEGDPVQVLVRVDGCDRQVSTNGARTTVVTSQLFGLLTGLVEYDGGTSALPNLDGTIDLPFGLQP